MKKTLSLLLSTLIAPILPAPAVAAVVEAIRPTALSSPSGPLAVGALGAVELAPSLIPAAVAPLAAEKTGEADSAAPSILLVGTSASRPFLLNEAVRTAEELGYTVYLLDKESARANSAGIIPDARFIAAPIDDHREETAAGIVARVAEGSRTRPFAAVVSFLNPFAQLAGDIADRTGARGASGAAVRVAHTKSLARQALARVPEIATPFRVVRNAEEAKEFLREQAGGRIVMKPIQGGGSQGVVTGIVDERQAEETYRRLDQELTAFTKRPDAGFFNLDRHPGIMVERELTGPEVDVELILQNGALRFSHVSDNAPMERPFAIEKNSTFASVLSPDIQARLVEAAAKAAAAMGLRDGNLHVEMMMTPDGPRVIEVNARMGGAFVWEFIREQTGVNLIAQGLRAVLGLPVDGGKAPTSTLEARFMIPGATGRIEALEGFEALSALPGYVPGRRMHAVGDMVKAAPDDAFDYLGYVAFRGKDYSEAMSRMMAALSQVKIRIRKADGTVFEQTGAFSHQPLDMNSLLAPAQRPGLRVGETLADSLARRDRIMNSYLHGQLALIASFALYYSLFAPVASALAGVTGVGAGRSGYAGAVAVIRPLAGVLVERFSVKTVLIACMAARAVLWAAALPAAFFTLGSGAGFLAAFVGLMILDGAIVSINGLVDIDEGGIDLLARQHSFPVDDALRNRYNSILDGFYSAGRIVVAPAMALLGVFAAGVLSSAAAALVVVMAASFAVPAAIGVYYYARGIPSLASPLGDVGASGTFAERARSDAARLGQGFRLAWSNRPIRWRILFNSFERAIEDSMLFVVLSEFAMKVLARGDAAYGAVAAASLIAFGKIGAIAAAYLMNRHWKPPLEGEQKAARYRIFFRLAAGGTLATALMPAAFFAAVGVVGFPWIAAFLAGFSALLFNVMFAASALGFRNLMQGIVSQQNTGGRLFGIQGTVMMAVNAAAILGLTGLFAAVGLGAGLAIGAGLYVSYGIFQALVGPRLIFGRPEARRP